MPTAKMAEKKETAAEKYSRLKSEQFESFLQSSFSDEALKDTPLFEVKVSSGMVFKCRKVDLSYYTNSGAMPMSLGQRVVMSPGGSAPTQEQKMQMFLEMSDAERRAGIQATAQMVRYICIEPRLIIGAVNGHKNAISVDALTMQDFGDLSQWAEGGEAADGLKTFRRKRR